MNKVCIKIISVVVAAVFYVNAVSFGLATLPASQNSLVKRKIYAALRRTEIRYAESEDAKKLLEANDAFCLLLSSGKYLLSKNVADNDISLLRAIIHEDIEAIMQVISEEKSSEYAGIKDILLNTFPPTAENDLPLDLYVNHIIAKAFEALILIEEGIILEGELAAEEASFLGEVKPIVDAYRHNFFSGNFWDANMRAEKIRTAIGNGFRFYQATQLVEDNISVDKLIEKLTHKEPFHGVVVYDSKVIKKLGKVGTRAKAAIPKLMDLLRTSYLSDDQALLGLKALERIAGTRDIAELVAIEDKMLFDAKRKKTLSPEKGKGSLQEKAILTLRNLLVEADEKKLIDFAVKGLVKIGKPAYPYVAAVLTHRDGYTDHIVYKSNVLLALGEFGAKAESSIPEIMDLLRTSYLSDEQITLALDVLEKIAGTQDIAELVAIEDKMLFDAKRKKTLSPEKGKGSLQEKTTLIYRNILVEADKKRVLDFAIRGLTRIGEPAYPYVAAVLTHRDGYTDQIVYKNNVLLALGEFGSVARPSVYTIVDLVRSKTWKSQRVLAMNTLQKITGTKDMNELSVIAEEVRPVEPPRRSIFSWVYNLLFDRKDKNLSRGTVCESLDIHPALEAAANEGRMFSITLSQVDELEALRGNLEGLANMFLGNLVDLSVPEETREKLEERLIAEAFVSDLIEGFKLIRNSLQEKGYSYNKPVRLSIVIEEEDSPVILFKDPYNNLISHSGSGEKTKMPFVSIYFGYRSLKVAFEAAKEDAFKEIVAHEADDLERGYHEGEESDVVAGLYDDVIDQYDTDAVVTLLVDLLHSRLKEDRTYTIRYDESRLSTSQIEWIENYAKILDKRADAKIRTKPFSSENGAKETLIAIYGTGKDFKGEGHVDIDLAPGEDPKGYLLRLTGMINIALAASNIPEKVTQEELKTTYKPLIAFIKRQYRAIGGKMLAIPYSVEDVLRTLRNIVLILPEASKMPIKKIEEYNKLAQKALIAA